MEESEQQSRYWRYEQIKRLLYGEGTSEPGHEPVYYRRAANKRTHIMIDHLVKRGYGISRLHTYVPKDDRHTCVLYAMEQIATHQPSDQHLDEVITILTLLQEVSL